MSYQQYGQPPPSSYGAPATQAYGQNYQPQPPAQYGSPQQAPQQAPQYGQPQYGQQQGAPQRAPAPQQGQLVPQQQGQYGSAGGAPPQQGQLAPTSAGVDPKVAAWFGQIDRNKNGSLDKEELKAALALGGLNYENKDCDIMITAFDSEGNRTLGLQEFVKLHEFITAVSGSFTYFDRNKRGALATPELTEALKHAGFILDPPVVAAIVKRHDHNNTQHMQLDEYIRMCLFLQSCVRTFGAFDTGRTGKVTLDFNQFVYGSSHIA